MKWRNDFPGIEFILVKGNHDILKTSFYQEAGIVVHEKKLTIRNFCFTHDIADRCDEESESLYTISGHIHPGVKVNGAAKQSIYLPCFYFGKEYAVLPAFSAFTGLAKIKPAPSDHLFVLVENKVIRIQ